MYYRGDHFIKFTKEKCEHVNVYKCTAPTFSVEYVTLFCKIDTQIYADMKYKLPGTSNGYIYCN